MTTLEIDGTSLEVTITDFDNFPKDIEEAEVIRSKETNSAFINKKFFAVWVAKYLKEIPLNALSLFFTHHKDKIGFRKICLEFLGEEYQLFDGVLERSNSENNSIDKLYCANIVNTVKQLSEKQV
jgi:hypothetical protein